MEARAGRLLEEAMPRIEARLDPARGAPRLDAMGVLAGPVIAERPSRQHARAHGLP